MSLYKLGGALFKGNDFYQEWGHDHDRYLN